MGDILHSIFIGPFIEMAGAPDLLVQRWVGLAEGKRESTGEEKNVILGLEWEIFGFLY